MSVKSVGKVTALDKMLDSESTRHEWSQSCVSCKAQIDLSVTHHHVEAFEGVCARELCAIKERGGKQLSDLELKRSTSPQTSGIYCQGLLLGSLT